MSITLEAKLFTKTLILQKMINTIFIALGIFLLANIAGIFVVMANSWRETHNNIKEDIIRCKWNK